MEGHIVYLIASIFGFLLTITLVYVLTINFHWSILMATIFIFLLSLFYLLIYIFIKKAPKKLIKYNKEYLFVYNKKIKYDEITCFRSTRFDNFIYDFFPLNTGNYTLYAKIRKE